MNRLKERMALAAKRQRDKLLAEKFERETWSLPPDQRHEAHKLTSDAAELLLAIAKHGGIEIGGTGSEIARLEASGFVEIANGDGRRASAYITREGALALLCAITLRREANQPKRQEAA